MSQLTALQAVFQTYGLERLASALTEYIQPAIRFELVPDVPDHLPISASSRVGGHPELPPLAPWPIWKNGPLSFIAQINLADVALYSPAATLPTTGLLSFFYDLEEQPWGYDPHNLGGFRVLYVPDTSVIVPVTQPEGTLPLEPCSIRFLQVQTLPHPGSRAFERLEEAMRLSQEEWDRYWDLLEAWEQVIGADMKRPQHQLLGHSVNIQGDMQLEAQLVTNGIYYGDARGYHSGRANELAAGADDWFLLFQLDSDERANLLWGDSGMLYYWIRRQDLAHQHFDRVWMTMQCH